MNDVFIVAGIAIGALTALGCTALYKGINGKLLTTVCSGIMAVVGFCFGQAV